MPPICFVTGASGFVGTNLAPLLAQRYRLRVLRRPSQDLPGLAGIDHECVDGTLQDRDALAAGMRGAEVVVHLAALVSFRRQDREAMFAINCEGSAAVAAAARHAAVRRLLHVSTISAVACSNGPLELDERAPYNFGPLHIGYCDSKFAAEQRVLGEVARGLDAVIVNPSSMYGAGDRRKGEGSLLAAVLQGRVQWAPPGGINAANVADVCNGCMQALDRGRRGERYILGGDNLRGIDLLTRVAAIVGGTAPRRTVPHALVRLAATALAAKELVFGSKPPLTAEVLRLCGKFLWYSSRKAKDELGYAPGAVDDGIRAAWRSLQPA